jgi:catechol 2,3-dioxygenase-like lactoylglutathione lyase family enzyme
MQLLQMTLAATNVPAMVAFYDAVLDARLQPVTAYGTTLYRGAVAGVGLLLCPNEIAGVAAEQSRHQLRLRVPDLARAMERARASGGSLDGEVMEADGVRQAAVRDPDGNTLELEQVL